jgi:hypothetical protein
VTINIRVVGVPPADTCSGARISVGRFTVEEAGHKPAASGKEY